MANADAEPAAAAMAAGLLAAIVHLVMLLHAKGVLDRGEAAQSLRQSAETIGPDVSHQAILQAMMRGLAKGIETAAPLPPRQQMN